MTITEIEITNIKGINHKRFKLQLVPNKPNLLIAPNGFGKSSIATAFDSMNSKRMTLADQNHHEENTSNQPELSITVNNQKLTANGNKNDIRQQFDVTVIRSGLVPKAKRTFGGGVSPSLGIQPIQIRKIPSKADFIYQASSTRVTFGTNGKVLPNISSLLHSAALCEAVFACDLSKMGGKRIQQAVTDIIDRINQQNGTTDQVTQWIAANELDALRAIAPLNNLALNLLKLTLAESEADAFLKAYQISEMYMADSPSFNKALEWLQYTAERDYYKDLLQSLCSSGWQWAKLSEDKKSKMLSVVFPLGHQLSNGQRDVVTLVIQMHKALYEGSKKPLILVIDEVFDYLDDANLVAFQYYVTSLIEEYKQKDQKIYPIILTHLDPGVFFDFCFNKHKIQTHYLLAHPVGKSQNTLRLVEARDNEEAIKARLEKHWFHYYPSILEIDESEWPGRLPKDWRKSEMFHTYTNSELQRYIAGSNFDPLAVCFALRVEIEKQAYSLLQSVSHQSEFLDDVRTTKNKINFVSECGADIPEVYFLLGLIYNTNLHWKQGKDYVSPLVSKLNHPTIKSLICEVTKNATVAEGAG